MFFSFAALFPDMQVLFMYIIPVKMKYLAIIDALFFLFSVISNPFPVNLLPIVAVLNFLVFCGGDLFRNMPAKASWKPLVEMLVEKFELKATVGKNVIRVSW